MACRVHTGGCAPGLEDHSADGSFYVSVIRASSHFLGGVKLNESSCHSRTDVEERRRKLLQVVAALRARNKWIWILLQHRAFQRYAWNGNSESSGALSSEAQTAKLSHAVQNTHQGISKMIHKQSDRETWLQRETWKDFKKNKFKDIISL